MILQIVGHRRVLGMWDGKERFFFYQTELLEGLFKVTSSDDVQG